MDKTVIRRKRAIAEAVAQQRLEGLVVSKAVLAGLDRWASGQVAIEALIDSAVERAKRGEILD